MCSGRLRWAPTCGRRDVGRAFPIGHRKSQASEGNIGNGDRQALGQSIGVCTEFLGPTGVGTRDREDAGSGEAMWPRLARGGGENDRLPGRHEPLKRSINRPWPRRDSSTGEAIANGPEST